jgi:hypothetical protein
MITLPVEKVINLQNVPFFWEAESLKLMLISFYLHVDFKGNEKNNLVVKNFRGKRVCLHDKMLIDFLRR